MTRLTCAGSASSARIRISWFLCGRRAPTASTNWAGSRYRCRAAATAVPSTAENGPGSMPFGTIVSRGADG
jgi:hypothetical protein